MYRKKLEDDIRCPLEYGLRIFGGKWNSRVLCVLAEKGTLRYSEIRREMVNITDAVLASTLKALVSYNMIERKTYDEIPPRAEYSLTDTGRSVMPILKSICCWAGAYHKENSGEPMRQCEKCDYAFGKKDCPSGTPK